jgi:predicted AlkP superfamily phosphohydrolase/phosphomutase
MRVVIIGLDAFEPRRFERLYEDGRVPNLARYVDINAYSRFAVSNPPQSEVSWTSIATGLNPGGHGMFDFVHRNPANYALNVSLLPTKSGFGGTQFAEPFSAKTIFDQAVSQGYPATALWWPALFPARVKSPVRSLPGLGTPDLLGRLGVGTLFTTDRGMAQENGRKTPVAILEKVGYKKYKSIVAGPMRKEKGGVAPATHELIVEQTGPDTVQVTLEKHRLELRLGEWSPILEIKFKIGFLVSLPSITQLILTQVGEELSIYALPLQIHPLRSAWHYGTPMNFVKDSWKNAGPFLTVGWPQDTTALEDGFIEDDHFIRLCESIVNTRERVLMHHLDSFSEGVLGCVFDTLDRMQHMFWRARPDLIDEWYVKMDALVGRVEQKLVAKGLKDKTKLVVISDHGFTDFGQKVHLNRWLQEHGYLAAKTAITQGSFRDVDWAKTEAYGIGLNSLYLNLSGREGKGIVQAGDQEQLLNKICDELLQWEAPNGQQVVNKVWRNKDVFDGPLAAYGPDVMVGFAPGFRASSQTGLGGWEENAIEPNNDHWGADHCIDPNAVPGVLFCSHGLGNFPNPSYRDIPMLTIGSKPDASGSAPPPTSSGTESDEVIEERLKSLGYL